MINKPHDNFEESLHLLCMVLADEAIITYNVNGFKMTIKNIDRKVQYTTSRPSCVRGFIETNKVMSIWRDNKKIFEDEAPEIAFTYTRMKTGEDGIARSIPVDLSNPVQSGENTWTFNLKFRDEMLRVGKYDEVALFIDWFPTVYTPKPIQLLFLNFFNDEVNKNERSRKIC